MAGETLVEQVQALPDVAAQRQVLEGSLPLLDEAVAQALKKQADRDLRADVHRSLQTAELMLDLAEQAGQPIMRALGLCAQANCLSVGGLGEFERAVALYNEAAEIYRLHGRPMDQARSQTGKLYALANLGRYDEAIAAGEWAGGILEQHEQWYLLATLTLNMGLIYGRMGDDVQALALFDRAGELYRRCGADGEPSLPWVDHDRAIVLRNLGRFDESLQASRSSQQMLIQTGQTVEAARSQQNMALTYYVLGRYNEALDLLDQASQVFAADGRGRDVVLAQLFVTDCLLQARRYADVVEKCALVRSRFAQIGSQLEAAQAYLNEAVAYAGLERYDEAMASLAEARGLFAGEGNAVWVACADLERAALLVRRGDFAAGQAAAGECAGIFERHDLPVRRAQAQLVEGRAAAALGQADEARRLVGAALAVAAAGDLPSLSYQCRQALGALAAAAGDEATARAEYGLAIDELERLRGRLMVEYRAGFLEDKQAVYEDMVLLCLDGEPALALDYVERAKSRALLDLLAYRLDLSLAARKPADQALVDELVGLRSERDRLYRRWEGREEGREEDWATAGASLQQVRREMLAIEKQITERWHSLLVHNADYARRCCPVAGAHRAGAPLPAGRRRAGGVFHRPPPADRLRRRRRAAHCLSLAGRAGQRAAADRAAVAQPAPTPGSTPQHVAALAANAQAILQRLHSALDCSSGPGVAGLPQPDHRPAWPTALPAFPRPV